jgi:UDP-glucose 4-epimerase
MHILVTGGAGFIGSHTVEMLVSAGTKVRVLDNLSTGNLQHLAYAINDIEFIHGSITDTDCVEKSMRGVTHVMHLAAQVSTLASIEHPNESHKVNMTGFLNVIDAAHRHKVTRFIYASSAAVYGSTRLSTVTEDSPTNPVSPYGLEKLFNDQYGDLYQRMHNLSALGLRYFNVYGPRQDAVSPYSSVISTFIANAICKCTSNIYGNGEQTRDFIYVKDIAKINVAALFSNYRGVLNVATGKSVTLNKLIECINNITQENISVRYTAERPGDIYHSGTSISRLEKHLDCGRFTEIYAGLTALIDYEKEHGIRHAL